jgi:O-antigen/teichoic acid export membrane protein
VAALTEAGASPAKRGVGGAARDSVANLVGVGVAALAGFALNVVIARGWSLREAGAFFAATSAFLIIHSVSRLGTGAGSVYFISRYRALKQPERIRASVVVGLWPVLAAGVVLAVAGWALSPWLASAIFPGIGAGGVTTLRILLVFVPAATALEFGVAACRGFGRMRPLLLVERLGRNGVQLAAVALVAWLGLSATVGLPLAWVLPYLPAAVIAIGWLAVLVHRTDRDIPAPVPAREEFRPFWRFTGPRAVSALFQIVVQRLDIVLLSALRGPAEAAIYTGATRFLVLGQLSGVALSSSVQHRLAGSLARDDHAEAKGLYQTSTAWLVLLAWPAYIVFAAFAEPMLSLFGRSYVTGRWVVVFLAMTMLLATACGMVDTVLNMAGKTAWTFYNALSGTVVNVAGNLLLIPPYGIFGAATAWSAAILVNNLVPLGQLWWSMRLHPFGRGTLTGIGMSAACFGLPLGLASVLDAGLPVLVGIALLGTVAYLAAAWRWRAVLQLDALRTARRRRNRPEAQS